MDIFGHLRDVQIRWRPSPERGPSARAPVQLRRDTFGFGRIQPRRVVGGRDTRPLPPKPSPAGTAWAVNADNLFEGAEITYTTDDEALPYTGQPVAMGVVSVVDATGEVYTPGDKPAGEVDYAVRYFVDSNHNKKLDSDDKRLDTTNGGSDGWSKVAPTGVGSYFIVAMNETGYNNMNTGNMKTFVEGAGYVAKYFEVSTLSLADAQAVNVVDADEGTYVEGFTYDAAEQNVGFVVDGKLLEKGKDYTVSYDATPINAGEYTAHLTGENAYDGSKADVKFTIGKLDLSAATIVTTVFEAGEAISGSLGENAVINGDADLTIAKIAESIDTDNTWKQVRYYGADGKVYGKGDTGYTQINTTSPAKGGYEFFAQAKAGDPNVTGEAYVTFNVVDEVVPATSFEYDDVALYDTDDEEALDGRVFDQSKGEAYDASLFSIAGKKDVDFTVTPSTEEGNTVGAHTAVVEVTVPSDYSIGGVATANYTVIAGVIDTDELDAIVILNGSNVEFGSTVNVPYTGEAVEPTISVSCNGTALVEGEDYTVTVTNDATGEAVEGMVDAGTYTVTLASDTYEITGTSDSFKIQIDPRDLGNTVWAKPTVMDVQGNWGVLYTGSAIDVEFAGWYQDLSNDWVQLTLDPSWYQLSGLQYKAEGSETFVPATEVLGVGEYKVNVTPTAECTNYTWDAKNNVTFRVVDTVLYADVAADAWYAEPVFEAYANQYMTGVAGTKLFMPENSISRAELAQVLFNMAGQVRDIDKTYPTKFSDVEADAWYAQAVAWASAAGVVTGYDGTDEFGTFDNATREAIATMLFRYAAAQGMDVSQRADISAYDDAYSVSTWAKDAVEWAVAEGIMGVDTSVLNPQGDAQRAEVAAMSVRLQPEPLVIAGQQ